MSYDEYLSKRRYVGSRVVAAILLLSVLILIAGSVK